MNLKHIVFGLLMLIAAAHAAQCSAISLDGDHLRYVEQYQEITVPLTATSDCLASYDATVFSDLPVELTPASFDIDHSTKTIKASIKPGAAKPGLYTVHILVESRQDIAREEFVVKVIETEDPLLTAEAPAVMRIQETEEFTIPVSVTNRGKTVLNNVVTFIDEKGEERRFAEELQSLQPGETKTVNFDYPARPRGEHAFNYTATAGEYRFVGQVTVTSLTDNYPLSSMITVTGHDKGYRIAYLVKNIGPNRLDSLFLTIEDAPSDWSIVSPPEFSLAPSSGAIEMELIVEPGEQDSASVHVALYEGSGLLAEDAVELSQARLSGTGLISFAESFEIGLIVLLLAVVVFLGWDLRTKARKKNISLRSLVPEWLGSYWPF
ncbi:MAG: hypothetical protein KAW41_02355 [Candidatus Diapherotrites archaeon]|nr:hypothetical protein [Candidatus Diapherotrites archaeon]